MIPIAVSRLLENLPPHFSKHYGAYRRWRWGDPSIRLLPHHCSKNRSSLDIGANLGTFTYFMAFNSKRTIAFEPNPYLATQLRNQKFPRTTVIESALSNQAGSTELRIPMHKGVVDPGRATIEPENELVTAEVHSVDVNVLDEYEFSDVGFMKIDVEGHELSVLKGASNTIKKCLPTIMIELDNRHNPGVFEGCLEYFDSLGYEGKFVLESSLNPLSDFDQETHQGEGRLGKRNYVSNFIFQKTRKNYS